SAGFLGSAIARLSLWQSQIQGAPNMSPGHDSHRSSEQSPVRTSGTGYILRSLLELVTRGWRRGRATNSAIPGGLVRSGANHAVVDVLVVVDAVLVLERLHRHLIGDNAAVVVGDLTDRGDLTVRDHDADLRVAVLDLEDPHVVVELLAGHLHRLERARGRRCGSRGHVGVTVNGLQHVGVQYLDEGERERGGEL